MDISSLLKRPNIEYIPEHVELPSPTALLPGEAPYSNVGDDVDDVRLAVQAELDTLDILLSELQDASEVTTVPVPVEYQDYVGSQEITLSAYLENMTGEDYGPQGIRDIFEEHISSSDTLDAPSMMMSLISGVKDSLVKDLDFLGDDIFAGNFDPSGARDGALWAVRNNLAESQRLRTEVLHAAELANAAIDKAIWAGVLDVKSFEEMRAQGKQLVEQLRRLQSLLKITTTLYSANWQSAVSSLRDRLLAVAMEVAMNKMIVTFNRSYNRLVVPAQSVLTKFGDSSVDDVEEVQNLKNILSTAIGFVSSKTSETLGDLYVMQQKKSALRINGARAVGVLAYNQRLINQLDIIIAGVRTALDAGSSSASFPLEASAAPGKLGDVLKNKTMYQLSPKEVGLIIEDAPPLKDVISTIAASTQGKSVTF